MFHSTAWCPEFGPSGACCGTGAGGRKGLSLSSPKDKKSSGLQLGPCLNLPARDTCESHGMLESQTWGEWRLLLHPASLTRAPHRRKHQISPAPPCGGHLCSSSTPGALRRHLMKGRSREQQRHSEWAS